MESGLTKLREIDETKVDLVDANQICLLAQKNQKKAKAAVKGKYIKLQGEFSRRENTILEEDNSFSESRKSNNGKFYIYVYPRAKTGSTNNYSSLWDKYDNEQKIEIIGKIDDSIRNPASFEYGSCFIRADASKFNLKEIK